MNAGASGRLIQLLPIVTTLTARVIRDLAWLGDGKTLFLRAVAQYITSSPSMRRTFDSVVVVAVSSSGSFFLRVIEKYCTTINDGCYRHLYMRILYCELAYLGS